MIPLARLLRQKTHVVPGQMLVSELFFEVPKDYSNPALGSLQLFGRSVRKHEKPIVPASPADEKESSQRPWLVALAGGPGFGHREPQDYPMTSFALSRGYQMLYLDYRGVGLSTPLSAASVTRQGDVSKQVEYMKLFRQDNNVRDLEAVRQCLTQDYPPEKKKWSLIAQSFGGFVSLSYLSFFPQGLREVFLTGGLAPVGKTPRQVYAATYRKVIERNEAYYAKFPEDVATVQDIISHIKSQGERIALPGGGFLTAHRLLTMGISFGGHGGLDEVHAVILRLKTDLEQFGQLTRASLTVLEQFTPFDSNIIYAILHEAIYCFEPGVVSGWAAYHEGQEVEAFSWLKELSIPEARLDRKTPLYFSGEMIFPHHFKTYPELVELREAADILAHYDQWPRLYDEEQLMRNDVPVYAVAYVNDMYVDLALGQETAAMVKGIKVYQTNALYHNAYRSHPEDVHRELFRLRDDGID